MWSKFRILTSSALNMNLTTGWGGGGGPGCWFERGQSGPPITLPPGGRVDLLNPHPPNPKNHTNSRKKCNIYFDTSGKLSDECFKMVFFFTL